MPFCKTFTLCFSPRDDLLSMISRVVCTLDQGQEEAPQSNKNTPLYVSRPFIAQRATVFFIRLLNLVSPSYNEKCFQDTLKIFDGVSAPFFECIAEQLTAGILKYTMSNENFFPLKKSSMISGDCLSLFMNLVQKGLSLPKSFSFSFQILTLVITDTFDDHTSGAEEPQRPEDSPFYFKFDLCSALLFSFLRDTPPSSSSS